MMSPYDFLAPREIHFGWGRISEIGTLAADLGRRAFLVSGSRTLEQNGTLADIESQLAEASVSVVRLATITREPEVADVDRFTKVLRNHRPSDGDFVIGIGGGAALDLAKALAAMATNTHGQSVQDFLEGVGTGAVLTHDPLPMLAVPTTAGTGSEVTKNAVISCYDPAFKKSLRSAKMVPDVVLVDPQLTVSVPPHITAQTGMDAITQLIESLISRKAQPIPQALCFQGLRGIVPALRRAVQDGNDRGARETLSHGALLSGMALANSGLGMAHGVAAALGVHCRVPHGLACAVMLPTAIRVNAGVCQEDLHALASLICLKSFSNPKTATEALIAELESLRDDLGIPARLSEIGVKAEQLPALVESSRGNSMNGNPRGLSDGELYEILEKML